MPYLRENPLDLTDPGNNGGRKRRADRMLHALEYGIDIARWLADTGCDAENQNEMVERMFRILWVLDRVSEGMVAASEFVETHWPDAPETVPVTNGATTP